VAASNYERVLNLRRCGDDAKRRLSDLRSASCHPDHRDIAITSVGECHQAGGWLVTFHALIFVPAADGGHVGWRQSGATDSGSTRTPRLVI
jgi:hypothetical protein